MSRVSAASIVVLLAVACTSGDEHGELAAGPDAASLRGGTLRVAVPDDGAVAVDLDPQRYSFTSWELARCCLLRTLYSYNGKPADEGGAEARPDLAAGMPEVSSDGLTWTFRLKEGLRYAPPFADTPIVARDIVRALEREARIGGDSYADYYSVVRGFDDYPEETDSIVGLETPNDRTLVVRLNEVTGDLPYRFTLPATAPIPEGASEGHKNDYGRFLVASGPYMVEGSEDLDFSVPPEQQEPASGFVPATLNDAETVEEPGSLVLVRNTSWHPATDPLRPAYPDRIEFAIGAGDEEAIARRVDAGEVDLVFHGVDFGGFGSPYEQVARYRQDPSLQDRVHVHANDVGFAITMNLAVRPFDDVHVRRAVNLAVDEASLVELQSQPPHDPGNGATEAGVHIAPDTLEGLLLRAFDPYPYDPAAAREEMRASAYDRTGDGMCDARLCRNVRALVWDLGLIPEQAEEVRDDLAELGIELELDVLAQDPFFRRIMNPRAQVPMVIAWPWGKDYPEGTGWFLGLFDDSGLGSTNISLVGASPEQLREWDYDVRSVPSIDDRLDACQQRRGVARTQCWAELDQYLMTEVVPRVPYIFTANAQVVSERVIRYSFDQFASLPALDRIALAPGSD
jgi:peptide/nickel transport system substrate-binding protein